MDLREQTRQKEERGGIKIKIKRKRETARVIFAEKG
jgi:hypothetical protein